MSIQVTPTYIPYNTLLFSVYSIASFSSQYYNTITTTIEQQPERNININGAILNQQCNLFVAVIIYVQAFPHGKQLQSLSFRRSPTRIIFKESKEAEEQMLNS